MKGKRDTAVMQLRLKFGDLPERVEERVQAMETQAELDRLLKAILDAQSLDDWGFNKGRKTVSRRKG